MPSAINQKKYELGLRRICISIIDAAILCSLVIIGASWIPYLPHLSII
jgi:hypothetical protein